MKSYGQFCPIAKAAEVVTERWTPLVLRELFCGSVRFNDLRRGVPLMSPSLLSRRLKELEDAGVLKSSRGSGSSEYHLTEAGRALKPIIDELGVWGKRWTKEHIDQRELDAGLLMWDLRRSLRTELLTGARTVLEFVFTGTTSGKRQWWLTVEGGEVDLCVLNPGFPVDLCVRAHVRTLTSVRLGDESCANALRTGAIKLEGGKSLARIFPRLFRESPLAAIPRV